GLAASSALLSGITGSASGAIGIVMNTLAPDYIAMGINPEVVHRITVIAAATLTAMPHSGVVITFNNLTGLSIKHGFIHQFIITNVAHLLALIAVLIASTFLY
ncbi:GntP family permease, partial [Aerococcus urinaeequi]